MIIPAAIAAIVGVLAGYVLQKIPALRARAWSSLKRTIGTLNRVRRFLLARKSTRIDTRAAFMSRRQNASLALLELTLFRWFEKNVDLLPHVLSVYTNHKNELVRTAASDLLWMNKPARMLQLGDIVRRRDDNSDYGHIVHLVRDDEGVHVTWDATHGSTSRGFIRNEALIPVTRRGWCPLSGCRYCDMGLDLCKEIGEWWWSREDARKEAARLRRGGENFMVESAEDAEKALHGIGDYEPIGTMGGKAMHAPDHYDYGPIASAQLVADLKRLADEGWKFQILRCPGYDHLPTAMISNWRPPLAP